jgi:putative FmdB family regulatory protein
MAGAAGATAPFLVNPAEFPMPLYSYECRKCGPFQDWRALSLAGADADCPLCGQASRRQVSMPFLSSVSRNVRIAHERNERSMERPRVMGREELHKLGHARGHSHGRSMYSSVLGHAH